MDYQFLALASQYFKLNMTVRGIGGQIKTNISEPPERYWMLKTVLDNNRNSKIENTWVRKRNEYFMKEFKFLIFFLLYRQWKTFNIW